MSEVKVNKITPRTNCGTTTLGDSGDTFNIPAGVTISNNGTATGFGATGAVNWDVASIKTVDFTATAGVGYFVDTATTGAVIVTLPAAPTAGDVVGVADYANNFNTANCTLNRNGSNIGGNANNALLATDGVAVTLVYVDGTKGWIVTDSGNQTDAPSPLFVAATGGCITTCGNYKIHTFYSPGTFCVSCAGNPSGSTQAEYLIIGGGGGGGNYAAGGGGAGGYRETPGASAGSYTVSPQAGLTALTTAVQGYPVAVGGGGAGRSTPRGLGSSGCSSTFNSQISAGGGGGNGSNDGAGAPGASGGGGSGGGAPGFSNPAPGGTGNQPVTSPPQGNDGGAGYDGQVSNTQGGGGGGALGTGGGAASATGGNGGAGAGTAINLTTMPAPSPTPSAQIGTSGPSPAVRYFAGGGAGSSDNAGGPGGTGGTGGVGGGGNGVTFPNSGNPGTINTGGGGAGASGPDSGPITGGNGGSGIVVIRYKYQ